MDTKQQDLELTDEGRRQALVKLGKYAAFTVPAVTTLLLSNKATAVSVTVGPGGVCIGPNGSCS